MNIHDALKQICPKKAMYFTWKNNIRYRQDLGNMTEESVLKQTQKKTLNSFIAWERTSEYKALVALLLDSQISNDLQEIYNKVSEQAKKTGDNNAVRLYLQLSKEIQQYAKSARDMFKGDKQEDVEEDDWGLEI